MQSHQTSFGEEVAGQKSLGHRRRPSLGKSMPVTSLLLNFSGPGNFRDYKRDDISPDLEKPPMYFTVNELDETANETKSDESSADDNIEQDYEILISECSSADSTDTEDAKISLIGNSIFYAPCLTVPEAQNAALSELCQKLCSAECHSGPSRANERRLLQPPPSKIEIQRKQFLTEMLFDGDSDSDNSEIYDIVTDLMSESDDKSSALRDFREKYSNAEALANTSAMTSPAARRRLAARKVEMELDYGGGDEDFVNVVATAAASDGHAAAGDHDDMEFVPPRDLLMYLVRMGSFNSAPKINNTDSQDDSLELPQGLPVSDLLRHFRTLRGDSQYELLARHFLKPARHIPIVSNEITEGLRVLKLNNVSKGCSAQDILPKHIRVLQWNILSQSLGQNNDGFVQCPDGALTWDHRKYLIVQEILQNNPDIICLQEVDHFKFLERVLSSQNYSGIFFPKPDSPCLYIDDNNGPDGCAIFYKRDKFELENFETKILEVWRVQSNQVAILANFLVKETGKAVCVCTTHLKARNGALLSKLRNEQGKDLLKFVREFAGTKPIIMCGDFNAEPIEPIYSTILNYNVLGLASAYADLTDPEESAADSDGDRTRADISASREPPYTTWKIREEGEVCHTIDYVFYSKKQLKVNNCLLFPEGEEIGKNRTPSYQYPSDHFSLVCDFEILEDDDRTE